MRIGELPIGDEFKELFESQGIRELYPPQESAVHSGLFEGKSIVLCTPTASGKTLTAEFAMCSALKNKKKIVYIVPLRALAYEKFLEFKKYESLGYKVRLEVGDLDSSRFPKKKNYDIMVATAEKCDSILRSRPKWFSDVGMLVLDEIHLIASDRGPVYEVLVAKFKKMFPEIQVLGLSATIGNADELADWLNAKLVDLEWRPVELNEEVEIGKGIEGVMDTVSNSLKDGGQVLVFVNSRRSAESVAEKLGQELKFKPGNEAKKIADGILKALSSKTKQCERLAGCVKMGVAFHHAGLVNKQRIAVEDAFKEGLIKVIVATPTLAAGVNLPARTVVIRDVKRYGLEGMHYIPVLEYKQQVGRAGRPKYDKIGYAITIAKSESEQEYIEERYINGVVEDITSRLGVEPVLRFHVLAAIASDFTKTEKSLMDFFESTFFGFQYGLKEDFRELIDKILNQLIKWKFIHRDGKFLNPTPVGSRIAELYIDPYTAYNIINYISKAEHEDRLNELGLLDALCVAVEMPSLSVKENEEELLTMDMELNANKLLHKIPKATEDISFQSALDYMNDDYLDLDTIERYKTAKLFEAWVNEWSEQKIMDDFGVAPGQLNERVRIMEWLAYSGKELARMLWLRKAERELERLETRVKYGVRKELLPLVAIPHIGRVRARKLFAKGIKTSEDVKAAGAENLSKMIGKKTAENVLAALSS